MVPRAVRVRIVFRPLAQPLIPGGAAAATAWSELRYSVYSWVVPAAHVEGLYSCLDYYQTVRDAFSRTLLAEFAARFPGPAQFTGGGACSGLYRGLKLWQAAVTEAGSLEQDAVIRALDQARIAEGPGGPAEMVPGQHHVRMNMYIARARSGRFEIVEELGVIEPNERDEPELRMSNGARAAE